jgi:hypothetical protein
MEILLRLQSYKSCVVNVIHTYKGTVQPLFIDFEKTCDSTRNKIFYNILSELGVSLKLVRLIKMCLNQTYSKVLINICLMHFLFRMI